MRKKAAMGRQTALLSGFLQNSTCASITINDKHAMLKLDDQAKAEVCWRLDGCGDSW